MLLCTMCRKGGAPSDGEAQEDTAAVSDMPTVTDGKLSLPQRPNMAVCDYAGVLGDSVRGLEDDLRMYAAELPAQIAVVTMADIGTADPQQIASEISHRWGVGEAGKDNGVVILVQPRKGKSSAKVAIAADKGVADRLSKGYCAGVVADLMTPKLNTGDYYGAVSAAVEDIVATLAHTQP